MDAVELARWATTAMFVLLAAVTGALASRRRHPAARWAFATFAFIATATIVARVIGEDPPLVVQKLNVLLLLGFAWSLFQFAASFGTMSSRMRVVANAAVAAVALWALVLPDFPAPGEEPGAGFETFLAAFVVVWTGLLVVIGLRLWRAGRDEPTLARRRMRLLGGGALLLGVALVGAAYAPDEAGSVWPVLVQVLAMAAGLGFLVGLAPPPTLRVAWRQPEERELYTSAVRLLSATEAAEVPRMILPSLARVVGARSAWIIDADGKLLATHGESPREPGRGMQVAAGAYVVHVWPSRYAPFFGDEEQRLLRQLSLLVGLGLERTEALEGERDARAQVEAANTELESFVYSASHDLRSPLIAMLGYLNVLTEEHGDDLDQQAGWYLERMRANGTYMEALIGDLLELSRVGRVETEVEDVDFGEVAADVAAELAERYPQADIRIGALPTVTFNRIRARQLLTNLVDNACKYGGRPDVRVEVTSSRGRRGTVAIRIADDGVGIPEEYRERVFGVFERLHNGSDGPGSGTGIGLAICQKVVAAAGGTIELSSNGGPGATFVIQLPVPADTGRTTDRTGVPA